MAIQWAAPTLQPRRHDAAGTVEGISGRLWDELGLDTLPVELLAVVEQTMQSSTLDIVEPTGTKGSLALRS
jgi:hypothetical protein